jgi:hypothetical protein
MSSQYSPDLRIELIGTGDQAGVWGVTTNTNLAYVLEQAIAGYVSVAVVSANQALTYINGGSSTAAANESVHASLALTTSTGANFAVYAPPASKQYTIYNASAYVATIYNSTVIGNTTAAGTGVAIPAGRTMTVWSDGTNFVQQNTHLISPSLASPTLATPALAGATYSTSATVIAGTNAQGQGALTGDINVVTTAAANPSGVTLPTATTGRIVTIVNKGANPINVYPATSAYIDGLAINTSIQIPVNSSLQFIASSTTQWYSSATGDTGSGANARAVSPTLNSPALTGTPTAPTAAAGTSTTQIATTAFLATMYPVGSIYSSTVATNPATLFGFGTWVAFAAGQVMIGDGGGFTAGATGGSADAIVVSHTHTVTDAGHSHLTSDGGTAFVGSQTLQAGAQGGSAPNGNVTLASATTGIVINSTGSSATNANLQPYVVVYMWNRTA